MKKQCTGTFETDQEGEEHLWEDVFEVYEGHVHLIPDLLDHTRIVHRMMHQALQLWKFCPAQQDIATYNSVQRQI